MAGPPNDVAPADLWIKLTERPRPTCDFQMPGADKDGQPLPFCKLWIMTEHELHLARAQADLYAKKVLLGENKVGDLGYADIYRNELFVQLVAAAARNPNNIIFPVFNSPKHAREKLTSDELTAFAEAYNIFRRHSGPLISDMTKDEMDAWIDVLMKGGSAVPLARLEFHAVTALLEHSVSLLRNSLTDNGSAGSPQGATQQVAASEPEDKDGVAKREQE